MRYSSLIILLICFSITGKVWAKDITVGLASNFSEVSSSSSNPFGDYFRNGIKLAIEDAKTKLDKKSIVVKTQEFDYGTSEARVLEVAKNANASQIVAIIGYSFSSHALLAAPIHQQSGLPMITPSATANRIGSLGQYVHQACFDNTFMGEALAHIAVGKLHAKKVALITAVDCAYCTDLAQAFETEFKKNGGDITIAVKVLQNDTDFTSVYDELKNQSFDLILVPDQELLSARIIASLSSRGITKPFLGGDGWGNVGEEFFTILKGKEFSGYSVSHWHPDEKSTRSKKFVADYSKEFGKIPNDTAVLAYDSMSLLIEALLKTNDFSRAGVERAIQNIKVFSGVTGKFIFRNKRAPMKSLVLLSANNSKFKVLERIEPTRGEK